MVTLARLIIVAAFCRADNGELVPMQFDSAEEAVRCLPPHRARFFIRTELHFRRLGQSYAAFEMPQPSFGGRRGFWQRSDYKGCQPC